jgi:hypothetical protein
MIICIDFDGTCVTHKYPEIGDDIGAVPVLKKLVAEGHKLILFTMRSNIPDTKGNGDDIIDVKAGNYLDDAVNWFKENDIPLYGVNTNPDQAKWTSSPKAYGQLYIDDAALGIPLIYTHDRPYVDWIKVQLMLEEGWIIPRQRITTQNLH